MDYTFLSAEALEWIKILLLTLNVALLGLIAWKIGDSGTNRPSGGGD